MQHFLDAENYLSGALELAPDRADRPEILLELGLALGNQNKQAEAIEQLEQAVWLEPENHRVAVALAGLWLDKWSGAEEPVSVRSRLVQSRRPGIVRPARAGAHRRALEGLILVLGGETAARWRSLGSPRAAGHATVEAVERSGLLAAPARPRRVIRGG